MEGGGAADGSGQQPLEMIGGGAGASQRMHSQDPASISGRAPGGDSLAEMKKRRKE